MVGWHQQLDGHEFEQASGVGDGQGSLVCCSPWVHRESDMTQQLNNNNMRSFLFFGSYYSGESQVKVILFYIHLRLVKAMVFPVVMYGCESWTLKKAEH